MFARLYSKEKKVSIVTVICIVLQKLLTFYIASVITEDIPAWTTCSLSKGEPI